MSRPRTNSFPDLLPLGSFKNPDDSSLEGFSGVAANVKLLLKLIQDHCDASKEDDGRRPQRVAGMITILDDVKSRVEKSAYLANRKAAALRRCNTDLRRSPQHQQSPKERRPPAVEPSSPSEEIQRLRQELSASMAARKSLEKMFASLGREKQLIAAELARKVRELSDMEELVSDLRQQNELLSEKVRALASAADE